MAGRVAGSARAAAIRRCTTSLFAHWTTLKERFGRSNPVATRTGSRSPSRDTMSAATAGVAVAVEARMACAPSQRAASARRKYSGRKSCPHWETQCASSTTNRPIRACRRRSRKPGEAKRSGATYSSRTWPATARSTARRFVTESCWALTSATRPGATRSSASTWSCISETRGDTTSVRSVRISAGSW